MNDQVGYRFAPTGEELINHYLKNKILGKTWLVEEVISEINICSKDPKRLPSLSKIQSEDLVWYFFSPKVYANAKKKTMKRTTESGFWKPTGKDRIIKDKRGSKGEIGTKKTLVYHEGKVANGVGTPWVMHEYHITCLPPNLRTYVICQVMYKGEDRKKIPFLGNNVSEQSQSLVFDLPNVRTINTEPEFEQLGQEIDYDLSVDYLNNPMSEQEALSLWDVLDSNTLFSDNNNNPSVQLEAPNDDEFFSGLRHVDREQVEFLFSPEDSISMPENPFLGTLADYSLDSIKDAAMISEMNYQGTSSSGGGYDLQTYADTSMSSIHIRSRRSAVNIRSLRLPAARRLRLEKLEVKQDRSRVIDTSMEKKSSMVKTEKKDWFITEEVMERKCKDARCIYVMIKIIGFIFLFGLIGKIISVLIARETKQIDQCIPF